MKLLVSKKTFKVLPEKGVDMWKPDKEYQVEYLKGYWLKDLLDYCKKKHLSKRFNDYMTGKTGGIVKDTIDGKEVQKLIVFSHDWERFMNKIEYEN